MAEGVAPITTRADPALVKASARAFRYQRMLDEGRYASSSKMAQAEHLERGYFWLAAAANAAGAGPRGADPQWLSPPALGLPRLLEPFHRMGGAAGSIETA
jgi:hypothetical protein